jgi:polyribonucleotide nucleotidyltransferase
MATVCGCALAMLDAGVPLKAIVAGVAMGLILGEKEKDEPVIMTDILGLEDALGTMDFKVAGNETGITTFQLDIKSEGLTIEILENALMQARRGRLKILEVMKSELNEPRKMKDTIPRVLSFTIPPEALGKVIGPKGKTVQGLMETHGVTNINLEDNGSVQIESFSTEKNDAAKEAILKIVASEGEKPKRERGDRNDKEKEPLGPPPEEGIIYRDCEIKNIHNFGVFVQVLPGYEGLVHVTELDIKKIAFPEKEFTTGQKIDVKYLGKNEKGQMRLSRRAVLRRDSPVTVTGAPATPQPAVPVVSSSSAEDAYN